MGQDIKEKVPLCVGVIMDGNRRWAKKKGLMAVKGHSAGSEKLKDIIKWAKIAGIKHIVAYAFSTENWDRTEKEVSYLLNLMQEVFLKNVDFMEEEGVRIRFIGTLDRFSEKMQGILKDTEERTKNNTVLELTLALSYGGRVEIVHALQELIDEGETHINEEKIAQHLWTKDTPDPELIIRTGGKMRLSNFLPWQSVYSELYFTDTLWPDLSEKEFYTALKGYGGVQRNFGK